MSGPNLAYCFPCPGCGEFIFLPRQSALGFFSTSQYLCTGVWPILFLCTRLSSLGEVPRSAIHFATELSISGTKRTGTLWEIGGDCCLESCGKRHSIYAHFSAEADPAAVSRVFMTINPRIWCIGGHSAKFHRDHLIASRLLLS